MKALLALIVALLCTGAAAQDRRAWEQTLADLMTAEDMESAEWEDTYEMLCTLEQHPLNLNTATREELEALPFLTERQVEDIMEYLYRYSPMKSMNKLRMVRSLDFTQAELLRCFAYVADERIEEFPSLIRNLFRDLRKSWTIGYFRTSKRLKISRIDILKPPWYEMPEFE